MKIAVLIPVYNVERYLRECLDSVLAARREFESQSSANQMLISCCDDGSSDESGAILREYAAKHERMQFVSQSNAGVVVARNRLMNDLPTDVDAFAFVDADDYVDSGIYAKLAEAFERTHADVAESEWDGEETLLEDMSVYLLRKTAPGQWINVYNKLYRRATVAEVRFRAGLCFEEDFFFNFEVHQKIHKKVLVPGRFYHHRHNPTSATNVLDQRHYFLSTTRRIRLSCEVFLATGRVPKEIESVYRADLTKDAYRMCLRKNLKKNRDATLRRQLFKEAGVFFAKLEHDFGIAVKGLNPMQRLIYHCCRSGNYAMAWLLSWLT